MPRGMPAFASLPQDQVTQIAAWLKSMNDSALRAAPPEQVAAGEKFFFGEGGCSGCHMVKGRGGDEWARSLRHRRALDLEGDQRLAGQSDISQMGVKIACRVSLLGFLPGFPMGDGRCGAEGRTAPCAAFCAARPSMKSQMQTLDGKFRLLDDVAIHSRYRARNSPTCRCCTLAPTAPRPSGLSFQSRGRGGRPARRPQRPVSQADIDQIMKPKSRRLAQLQRRAGRQPLFAAATRSTPPM